MSRFSKNLDSIGAGVINPNAGAAMYMSGRPNAPSYNGGGTYGEGAAFSAVDQIKQLRAKLDSGAITAKEFLDQAHPMAQDAIKMIGSVAGHGSKAANIVNPLVGQLKDLGFVQKQTGEVIPQLGEKYEQELRNATLPGNIPDSQRDEIGKIPTDIPINSDRGQIEREAIREQGQAQEGLDSRTALRKQSISDLSDLLNKRDSLNLQQSIPGIAEQANNQGIFRSTGYGDALARYASQNQAQSNLNLQQQALKDRELQTLGMQDITDNRIAGEQAGLQRQFSLDDFTANRNAATQFADASKPQSQGKSSGEKWAQGIQAGVGIGGLAAAPFTGGSSLAATAGAGATSGGAGGMNPYSNNAPPGPYAPPRQGK